MKTRTRPSNRSRARLASFPEPAVFGGKAVLGGIWGLREPTGGFTTGQVRARSDDEGTHDVERLLDAVVFRLLGGVFRQEIEAQAVEFGIEFLQKASAQEDPLRRFHSTFKHRVLHSDSVILAGLRQTSEPSRPEFIGGSNIVANEDEHGFYLMTKGGYTSRSPLKWRASSCA